MELSHFIHIKVHICQNIPLLENDEINTYFTLK